MTSIDETTFFNQPIPSDIRLPNIEYLEVKLPIIDHFWSVVPNLHRLYSLVVSSYTDTFRSEMQTLLDRASHLHILRINQDASLPLQMSLFECTNASIRQIDLQDYKHGFSHEECLILTRSSLGVQCEVLSIRVNNPESIVYLVKNMINLRTLHVYWDDEKNSEHIELASNNEEFHNKTTQTLDELFQWLKDHLPSTCLVANDPHYPHCISIWI